VRHRHNPSFFDALERAKGNASRAAETASPEQRELLREHVRQIRFSRDLRQKSFDRNIFGEPAWDVLLALYTIDRDQRRLNIRELAKLTGLALTTALRWLDYLEEQGLIDRKPNPFDQRMVYVELSNKGREAMDRYLMQMRGADMFGSGASSKS
jgi:DNA-binding MarR family transcriptional regulator